MSQLSAVSLNPIPIKQGYRHKQAHEFTNSRHKQKHKAIKLTDAKAYIIQKLKLYSSAAQIVTRLQADKGMSVHAETAYCIADCS